MKNAMGKSPSAAVQEMTGNTKPPARKPPPGSSPFTFHLSRFIQNWLFQLGPDTRLPIVLNQRRIFILPTAGGLLYALMLVVMLLGAINYDLSLGHALVFLLAGLGFVGMVHAFRNLIALRLTPLRAEPVFAGETARFRLRVENPRDHDRRALEFAFRGQPTARLDLPPHADGVVDLPCHAPQRGRLEPGRITLSTRYPLGLFRAWSYPHPPFSGLVYPRPLETPLPIPAYLSASGQFRGDPGQEDFTGLRQYQPNDSPRHIAWKAVARDFEQRPLLVKQFAGGGEGQLILDWSLIPPGNDMETCLSILTAWVLAAEQQHLSYGLRLPGIDIAPSSGSAHREHCLEILALYG